MPTTSRSGGTKPTERGKRGKGRSTIPRNPATDEWKTTRHSKKGEFVLVAQAKGGSWTARGAGPIARAMSELAATGKLTGSRSEKISARVDPGVMKAAAERLGLEKTDVSDVVNAALALAAAPDRFKAWLGTTEDRLPDDFELAV